MRGPSIAASSSSWRRFFSRLFINARTEIKIDSRAATPPPMVTTHFHVGIWSHAGGFAQSDTHTHSFTPLTTLILARFWLHSDSLVSAEPEPAEPDEADFEDVVVSGAVGSAASQLAPDSPSRICEFFRNACKQNESAFRPSAQETTSTYREGFFRGCLTTWIRPPPAEHDLPDRSRTDHEIPRFLGRRGIADRRRHGLLLVLFQRDVRDIVDVAPLHLDPRTGLHGRRRAVARVRDRFAIRRVAHAAALEAAHARDVLRCTLRIDEWVVVVHTRRGFADARAAALRIRRSDV